MDLQAERSYPTPYANSPLLPLLLLSLSSQRHTPLGTNQFDGEYDYIIVGAGSAGSVVANRLSELPCVRVLLLEAGKPPPRLTEVPIAARGYISSDIDWTYFTTPQRFTGNGMVNRQVPWPSGKMLGGSSAFNVMLYIRGNPKNYDDWAAQGAVGWSYEEVLPYFKKLEDFQDPVYLNNGYHNRGGPMTISKPGYISEIKEPLIESAINLGYRFVDSNGPTQTGFYDFHATLRGGQRCSTAKAYLVPAENRTNLDILPNAMVRKVIVENNRATGVHFDYGGITYEVRARKEVILSAGTTNTAQLLMLSGIGPRKELNKFNIPMVADLPVGENFQDHCGTFLLFELSKCIPSITEKIVDPRNIETYILNKTGPLSSTEGISLIAFRNNNGLTPGVDCPDHQILFVDGAVDVIRGQYGIRPDVYDQVLAPYANGSFYGCVSSVLHPRSRGTVKLQSSNPYDPPLIDPNYFEHPQDIEDVVQGMKACHEISTSPSMARVGSRPFNTLYPGCEDFVGDQDEYFRCQARSVVLTFSHQVGTAKMGDPMDPTTVVDPELRVKGIESLRVVDASIMPIIPYGNTNIPTIMLAEKASDIIKKSVRCRTFRNN